MCLLDKMDKLFQKIVTSPISKHLSQESADLADNQFDFRTERSTTDTPDYVKSR